jgi:predicted SAM-dependent methyltransferase
VGSQPTTHGDGVNTRESRYPPSLSGAASMISQVKRITKQVLPFAFPLFVTVRCQVSKRRVREIVKKKSRVSVELGAGNRRGQGEWLTIDMNDQCDLYWDLRRGIPFPDESIQKLYSSHFFEHLSFAESQRFLDECKRVLVPNGQFSICVPNARIYIEAYMNGNIDAEKFLVHQPAYNRTTRIDYVNYMAYMDGHHKYMFDEENLLHILSSKGFKDPHLRPFDPTLDLQVRDYESIYAEATK